MAGLEVHVTPADGGPSSSSPGPRPGPFGLLLRQYHTTAWPESGGTGRARGDQSPRLRLPRGWHALTTPRHRSPTGGSPSSRHRTPGGPGGGGAGTPVPEHAEMIPRGLTAPLTPIVGREQDEAAALSL